MRPASAASSLAALPVLTALLVACSGGGPAADLASPETHTVGGALTITTHRGFAGDAETPGSTCTGIGGMDDIGPGTPVRVATDAGATLALGALGAGATTDDLGCRFPFTIPDVALGADAFYIVEVGNRGQVRVERANLLGGTVTLTL